jgi:uncharacterized protein GlcG (DUF336 family)
MRNFDQMSWACQKQLTEVEVEVVEAEGEVSSFGRNDSTVPLRGSVAIPALFSFLFRQVAFLCL